MSFYEGLSPVDCAMIGRSNISELQERKRILLALASPENMQLVLESAMDEPPNLEMVGAVSLVCTRATVGLHPSERGRALKYERLAGLANQFLDMLAESQI